MRLGQEVSPRLVITGSAAYTDPSDGESGHATWASMAGQPSGQALNLYGEGERHS